MPAPFDVRVARPADAAIIAWHRARMFQDMGDVPPALFDELRTTCQAYIGEALARREYVGWLASPADDPEIVVAGAGVQLRRVFPHMLTLPGWTGSRAGASRHRAQRLYRAGMATSGPGGASHAAGHRLGSRGAARPPRAARLAPRRAPSTNDWGSRAPTKCASKAS